MVLITDHLYKFDLKHVLKGLQLMLHIILLKLQVTQVTLDVCV